ncbi:hypothetical protein F4V43_02420 [Paenibacillus spiritus]|uniref:Uncharacterized protein n=1 Tax=Paenibacillus spiritus TaxID=2496557 RepID=A0A5J5GGS6_9BACL|nr:LPD29 domain-containing protein [Paenibacillus spiritus]KAA9007361.1 hypothetical protein F4V43_02420 [Paenibacillus spiritus]
MAKTQIALTAQALRQALKEAFPLTKFSVRSSAGCAINVSWTDLPSVAAVEAITDKYKNVSYDHHTGEILSGANTYVFCNVEYSPEFTAEVESRMPGFYLLPENKMYYNRKFGETVKQIWEEQNAATPEMEAEEAVTSEIMEVAEQTAEAETVTTVSAEPVNPEPVQSAQIPVQSITFLWAESSVIAENTTVSTFAEANAIIKRIAYEREYKEGYSKTAFIITWADGRTHDGRIDVSKSHINDTNPLGNHVYNFYMSIAGLKRPFQWSEDEYKNMLTSVYKMDDEKTAEVKHILAIYMFDDVSSSSDPDKKGKGEEEQTEAPTANETATEAAEPVYNAVSASTPETVSITLNAERNGVEIRFASIPSPEMIAQLKSNGFRWSKPQKMWYAKQSTNTIAFANSLEPTESPQGSAEPYTYPDININDIDTYTISKELQRREHDSNWIFRREEKDRTKEIQDYFTSWNETVSNICNTTDNQRIIYYLKKALQSFKKKYHANKIAYLTAKAATPNIAVTGRGGVNVNHYNKKMDRIDKLMKESIEITDYMKQAVDRAKRDIYKDERQAIQNQINSITDIDSAQFKTDKLPITVAGYTETKRVYIYKQYMIAKAWGCFRVFTLDGREIESNLKTTDTLTDAKRFVLYLVNKDQQNSTAV